MTTQRRNNIGNIRHVAGQTWIGQTGQEGGFATFDNLDSGTRALIRLLRTYKDNGFNTIDKIINRYAPPTENNTKAYILFVAKETGINPATILRPEQYGRVARAIVKMEGVQPLNNAIENQIDKYTELFFGNGSDNTNNEKNIALYGLILAGAFAVYKIFT